MYINYISKTEQMAEEVFSKKMHEVLSQTFVLSCMWLHLSITIHFITSGTWSWHAVKPKLTHIQDFTITLVHKTSNLASARKIARWFFCCFKSEGDDKFNTSTLLLQFIYLSITWPFCM